MDMDTRLCLTWRTSKDLLDRAGNSAQCHVAAWMPRFSTTRHYCLLSPGGHVEAFNKASWGGWFPSEKSSLSFKQRKAQLLLQDMDSGRQPGRQGVDGVCGGRSYLDAGSSPGSPLMESTALMLMSRKPEPCLQFRELRETDSCLPPREELKGLPGK